MIFKYKNDSIHSIDIFNEPTATCLRYTNWIAIKHAHPSLVLHRVLDCLNEQVPFVLLYPNEDPNDLKDAIENSLLKEGPKIDFFIRSSGTSGRPKLVPRTLDSWICSFEAHVLAFDLKDSNSILIPGPMIYSANLYHSLLSLWLGQNLYLCASQHIKTITRAIHTQQIDTIYTVPSFLSLIIRDNTNLDTLNKVITVGEKMSKKMLLKVLSMVEIKAYHYFGASELGQLTYANYSDLKEDISYLGIPFKGVKLSLSTNHDIIVHSKYTAIGYPSPATVFDKASLHQDKYYYRGREDDQINIYGKKFNLNVIRTLLDKHHNLRGYYLEKINVGNKEGYNLHLHTSTPLNPDYLERLAQLLKPNKIYYYHKVQYSDSGKCNWIQTLEMAKREGVR